MADEAKTLQWNDAVDGIAGALAARSASGPGGATPGIAVIGITGPAGAGKSTLARRLLEHAGGVVISTDEYLPDYELVPEADRDLPEHADLPLLAENLRRLRSGAAAEVPVWSFHEHKRVGSQRVGPVESGVIVVEGLFALHASLGDAVDLRVFVEAPAPTRWARWEAIEERGERGMGVEAARAFFHEVADPTYARFADGYRGLADRIVINHG